MAKEGAESDKRCEVINFTGEIRDATTTFYSRRYRSITRLLIGYRFLSQERRCYSYTGVSTKFPCNIYETRCEYLRIVTFMHGSKFFTRPFHPLNFSIWNNVTFWNNVSDYGTHTASVLFPNFCINIRTLENYCRYQDNAYEMLLLLNFNLASNITNHEIFPYR